MEIHFIVLVLFSALTLLIGTLSSFYFSHRILCLLKSPMVWVIAFAGYFLVFTGYFIWLAFFFTGDEKFLFFSVAFLLAGVCEIGYGGIKIYLNLNKVTR